MTTAEAVETTVTTICNSLSQDYTNLDDHISETSIDLVLIITTAPKCLKTKLKRRNVYFL